MDTFLSTNITLAAPTTTVVRTGPGILAGIVINKATANGVIAIYDGVTVASGTLKATITMPGTLLASQVSIPYFNMEMNEGITIVTSTAAQDITVLYK
jgi:hypothetical protein